MQWELLNGRDFEQAVGDTGGICVAPLGSLERHGDHMSLGTDYLNAHKIACLAAEIEPVVVFPGFYFGQVCESMASPGTIALKPELLMQLLRGVFDEISRNGFKKIIVLNGHGGNNAFLQFMGFSDMREPRDYTVYYKGWWELSNEEQKQAISADCEGRPIGHACEWETSVTMFLQGEASVNLDYAPVETSQPLDRINGMEKYAFTGANWFAVCPECYMGNARYASAERGKRYAGYSVQEVADLFKSVKADTALPLLQQEYYRRSQVK